MRVFKAFVAIPLLTISVVAATRNAINDEKIFDPLGISLFEDKLIKTQTEKKLKMKIEDTGSTVEPATTEPSGVPSSTYEPTVTPSTLMPTAPIPYAISPCTHILCNDQYSSSYTSHGPLTNSVFASTSTSLGASRSSPVILSNGNVVFTLRSGDVYIMTQSGSIVSHVSLGTPGWTSLTVPNPTGISYSTPAVGIDDTIYIATYTTVFALNPDLSTKWTYVNPNPTGPNYFISSPTLGNGNVFVTDSQIVGSLYMKGNVYALSIETGSLVWVNTDPTLGFESTSATVRNDGGIYVGCLDQYFYAISSSGTTEWTFQTDQQIFGTAAIDANDDVYFGGASLYKANSDPSSSNGYVIHWSRNLHGNLRASPSIGHNGTVYAIAVLADASYTSTLFALNGKTGHIIFSQAILGQIIYSATAAVGIDNIVYFNVYDSTHGYTYAYSQTGSLVWQYTYLGEKMYSTPIITDDGHLIVMTATNGYFYNFHSILPTVQPSAYPTISNAPTPSSSAPLVVPSSGPIPIIASLATSYLATACSHILCSNLYSSTFPNIGPDFTSLSWISSSHGISLSSPIIDADGSIIVSLKSGALKYLNSTTGAELKSISAGSRISFSTPAIDNTRITYVAAYDHVVAIFSGSLLWSYTGTLGSELIVSSPTLGATGSVYFATYNSPGKVYALDSTTGSEKWMNTDATGGFQGSSPTVRSDGVVLIGNKDGYLYAISASGVTQWTFETSNQIFGTPSFDVEGNVYIGSTDSNLYKLNPSGSLLWQYTTSGSILSSAAVGANGDIYFASNDIGLTTFTSIFYVLSTNGTLISRTNLNGITFYTAAPAVAIDGTAYIATFGAISPTSPPNAGFIYAITASGNVDFFYNITGDGFYSTPVIGSDGKLYVASYLSQIFAFTARTYGYYPSKCSHILCNAQYSSLFTSPGPVFNNQNFIVSLGYNSYSTPLIRPDGNILVQTNSGGYLIVSPTTGAIISSSSLSSSSHYSTPAIDIAGNMYLAFDDGLYVVSSSGTFLWSYSVPSGFSLYTSPTLSSSGHVYIATYASGNSPAPIYALNVIDGSLAWVNNDPSGSFSGSTPVIRSDGVLCVGSLDGNIYAISPVGLTLWTYNTEHMIYGSAAITTNNAIVFGSTSSFVYKLSSVGSLVWSYNVGVGVNTIYGSPGVGSDGTIFIVASNIGTAVSTLFIISADGTAVSSSGSLSGTAFYSTAPAIGPDNSAYYTTLDTATSTGSLYGISVTGSLLFTYTGNDPFISSPVVDIHGSMLVLGAFGTLISFEARSTIAPSEAPQSVSPTISPTTSPTIDTGYALSTCAHIGCTTDYNNQLISGGPIVSTTRWIESLGTVVYSSPVIQADGSLIIATHSGDIYVVSSTGDIVSHITTLTGNTIQYSTPAVGSNGNIYVAAGNSLYTLSKSGSIIWSAELPGASVYSSPTLSKTGGKVYVASYGSVGGHYPIYAYSISDGTLLWTNVVASGGFRSSSPVIRADGALYIGSLDGFLYAIDSSGSNLWSFSANNQIIGTAAIFSDDAVVFGSVSGTIYKISSYGTQIWSVETGLTVLSSPAIGVDGTVYIGASNLATQTSVMVAIASAGTKIYTIANNGIAFYSAAPAVDPNGLAFYTSYSQTSLTGYVNAVSAAGSIVWTTAYTVSGVVSTPIMGADRSLYIVTLTGDVMSFVPRPSDAPSTFPSYAPSVEPSASPSHAPSSEPIYPSKSPSAFPSTRPSKKPSLYPSMCPSYEPTAEPSTNPSAEPTTSPSKYPTYKPSKKPSFSPTIAPSTAPSTGPSVRPSVTPSNKPSTFPTYSPSTGPTFTPSFLPSVAPTVTPTIPPSFQPSQEPSFFPTAFPTLAPSSLPSFPPSKRPSANPSTKPTLSTQKPTVSNVPTTNPSNSPSTLPSVSPSNSPTTKPSFIPTATLISKFPTLTPSTKRPTLSPFVTNKPAFTAVPQSTNSFAPFFQKPSNCYCPITAPVVILELTDDF